MSKKIALWLLAVAITVLSAYWQRTTGPTRPVRGEVAVGGAAVSIRLDRSHEGDADQPVRIDTLDPEISGEVRWRRFPTDDRWAVVPLRREANGLEARLPHQPPAGKIEYQVRLSRRDHHALFPPRPAVTRFKAEVSPYVLVLHVFAMFVGMLLSARAGLEALTRAGDARRLTMHALGFLVAGGLVLGPMVQKAAFGAYWTGVPFGWDLTDNKTLIAAAAWIWAAWRLRGDRGARREIVAAAAITAAIFAIPHSTWGSEIDWE